MRRLNVLTWHTHGSYLYYLSHAPHDFYVLVKPERPPGYGGRCGPFPFGPNVRDLPADQARTQAFDCILFQEDHHWERDASGARIAIAPCGFDPDELWPMPRANARAALALAPDRFTVLQLGRMVPRKGVDTVIEAVALLRAAHGIDAGLLVVGGDAQPGGHDGAELARLRALADALGIAGHVQFAGQQPRAALRLWYGAADVFATTPWYEPFGITPVEAMACARPVVGADVGGIKRTVVDGATGFLVPARDPHALAARLAHLQRDPVLARTLGDAGLRRAHRHYTWRTVAQQVAAIHAAVLAEARAPLVVPQPQE